MLENCAVSSIIVDALKRATPKPLSESQQSSLAKLQTASSPVIMSGQQVGLFGGPLFNLAKFASIVAAQKKMAPGGVLVFWAQSEDHDLKEIDCYRALRSDGVRVDRSLYDPNDLELERHTAIFHHRLPSDVEKLLEELSQWHAHLPSFAEISKSLQSHYRPGATWTEAFIGFWNDLFRDDGILFFDPRSLTAAEQHELLADFYRDTLRNHAEIERRLLHHSEQELSAGRSVQVPIRRNSPLFFIEVLPENNSGTLPERFRLLQDGDEFGILVAPTHPDFARLQNRKFTRGEILNSIENETERFSPSALLRPVIQEIYFPGALYIGGHGEAKYFKQVDQFAELLASKSPTLISRANFRIIEPRINELIAELKIPLAAILSDSVEAQQVIAKSQNVLTRDELQQTIDPILASLTAQLASASAAIDSTLLGSVERVSAKLEQAVAGFLDRYEAAVLRGRDVYAKRLERVRTALLPENIRQDVHYNAAPYLAQFGRQLIVEMIDRASAGIGNNHDVEIVFERARSTRGTPD